jgi:glycosyltransferase involved in cell wall biosynthesis
MRVLHAIAGRRHGGAEAFFERLVVALGDAGLEQRLVIRRNVVRAARLRAAGFDPVGLRFGGMLDIATRLALLGEVRRYRPDVILTWMSRASTQMPPRWLAGDHAVRVGRLGGYYDLKYYRHCDHLIANTRDLVAYIRNGGWPENRVHYLPNFVDSQPAAPADRAALGVPANGIVALALGRFHPNKAFDVLLQAVARSPAVNLWLAGDGDLRATLEDESTRLGLGGRVRFLGWRDDVGALMAASDMVVCPSRHEPLGNVVIEAWARRRPVIGAASAGPSGLIVAETSGLLVPVDDAAALAAAMNRLADDATLRDRLASAGFSTYAAEFTRERVVGLYMKFFEKVAG